MPDMLNIRDLDFSINGKRIIDSLCLDLKQGSIGCLMGASGSGKTILLHCIAGFHRVDKGSIRIGQRVVSSKNVHIPPEDRRVGMMFQNYALFPHLSVEKNIGFGIRKMEKTQRRKNIDELLELVELTAHQKKYPHELSGGEQQRVALARALAPEPRLLLLDEPFSSLDTELRLQLAEETREIITARRTTALLITHEQEDAFAMADMLGIIDAGHLLQWDSSYDIYHKPISHDVATFIGMGSLLQGEIYPDGSVETVLGRFPMSAARRPNLGENRKVNVLIRPDDIVHDDASAMKAMIRKKRFRGPEFLYQLQLDNDELIYCFAPSHHNHHVGESIGIVADVEHVIIYPR